MWLPYARVKLVRQPLPHMPTGTEPICYPALALPPHPSTVDSEVAQRWLCLQPAAASRREGGPRPERTEEWGEGSWPERTVPL